MTETLMRFGDVSLEEIFPGSMTLNDMIENVNVVVDRLGHTPGDVKPAVSLCRDDTTDSLISLLRENGYLKSFKMNTLSGVPYFGMTGFGAFYHHIPDKGIGMIIYAPHIGMGETGGIGKLNREGREHIGLSCGANHAMLSLWDQGKIDHYEGDPELSLLSSLIRKKENILSSENPLLALTSTEYEVGLSIIKDSIKKLHDDEKNMHRIIVVAGIHIDTDHGMEDLFQLREIGMFDSGRYTKLDK